LDIASSVADSASCMTTEKKKDRIVKRILQKYMLGNEGRQSLTKAQKQGEMYQKRKGHLILHETR